MSRTWIVEPSLSVTGSNADERRAMSPSSIASIATHLAKAIAHIDVSIDGSTALTADQLTWVNKLAANLSKAGKPWASGCRGKPTDGCPLSCCQNQ